MLSESCTDCQVGVYNVQGIQVMDSQPLQVMNTRLDVESLQSGIYIIRVNSSNGAVAITKFTKR